MTIIAGFRCENGVVLAADTEITLDGGTGKTYESKIFVLDSGLGCHLAYTGVSDFAAELEKMQAKKLAF
jgi:20S proteasome alpha/beta subunit